MTRGALRCVLCAFLACVNLVQAEPIKVHVIFSQHLDVGFNSRTQGVIATDDAAINLYFDRHFPAAIATAAAFRSHNSTRSYQWMAHAWLLSLYFDCPIGMGLHCPTAEAKKEVDAAIRRGDIYWHALPFNGQAEFFDAPLLEFAAFMVHRLDDQFKLPHKRVASLRDVPGITRAAIPILHGQGVHALSQGVNGASAPPGVPKNSLHWWKDPASNTRLLHWVHPGGYSGWPQDPAQDCVQLPNFSHILCHAWKQDNEGPHTVQEASNIYSAYEAAFPGAQVVASTFDAYLAELKPALPGITLPTYSGEIGDTWIYGIPSDAVKVSRYLAALRLRSKMTWRYDDYAYFNFSRLLMKMLHSIPEILIRHRIEASRALGRIRNHAYHSKVATNFRLELKNATLPYSAKVFPPAEWVPEHTWGVDIKTTIDDYTNWSNKEFHALLKSSAQNFQNAVGSWQRQAKYVDWALEALGLSPEALAPHLASPLPNPQENSEFKEALPGLEYRTGAWKFALDPRTGGIRKLHRLWGDGTSGVNWASSESPLGQLIYETFQEDDFNTIFDHYTYAANARSWAELDFGKLNCSQGHPKQASLSPNVDKAWDRQVSKGADVLLRSYLPEWAWKEAGAPQELWTRFQSSEHDEGLYLDITFKHKTPTRLPEAAWLKFQPNAHAAAAESWLLHKLGQPISPLEVMLNGSQSQHTVSPEGISIRSHVGKNGHYETLTIKSLDAPLVSPGKPTAFPIGDSKPDLTYGISYGLINNLWGTNYPQWQPYDEAGTNLTFRFVLTIEQSKRPAGFAEKQTAIF